VRDQRGVFDGGSMPFKVGFYLALFGPHYVSWVKFE
jgi:hypothetical protein